MNIKIENMRTAILSIFIGIGVSYTAVNHTIKAPTLTTKKSNTIVVKDRGYYVVGYDENKKCPLWVSYKMSPSDGKRNADRSDDKFYTDNDIKTATSHDYDNTGYDRGHMVASADMAFSEVAQKESFRMSNVCLQTPALNRGEWKKLEAIARSLAKRSVVDVSSGPIYDVSKKRINGILLPVSYWKVYKVDGVIYGYVCQNGDTKPTSTCSKVDLNDIEKMVIDDTPFKRFK